MFLEKGIIKSKSKKELYYGLTVLVNENIYETSTNLISVGIKNGDEVKGFLKDNTFIITSVETYESKHGYLSSRKNTELAKYLQISEGLHEVKEKILHSIYIGEGIPKETYFEIKVAGKNYSLEPTADLHSNFELLLDTMIDIQLKKMWL